MHSARRYDASSPTHRRSLKFTDIEQACYHTRMAASIDYLQASFHSIPQLLFTITKQSWDVVKRIQHILARHLDE